MNTQKLYELINPAVTALGYELWGCELVQQDKHQLLRIYVEGESGITLDACAKVSRQVGAILDVEDPIYGRYTLEVSSPGMARPLFTAEQYRRYVGQMIKLKLKSAVEDRRNWTGILEAVEEDKILLKSEDQAVSIMIKAIDKAHLVPQF